MVEKMFIEKVVDFLVWAPWLDRIPKSPLRFFATFAAFAFLLAMSWLWIPLAIIVGICDMWKDATR